MGEKANGDERLGAFLAEIANGTDFPALSHSLELVLRQASEDDSIQHLTNLILKDFSMTLKLLRSANSALYNRSGRPILSITHAVALLGVEAVCQMVAGLLLIGHLRGRSPGLKELMLLSLLSAGHAREVAERVGYPRREEAYLSGMFCNLGEILIARYRPREYASILVKVQKDHTPVRDACAAALGFDYEHAGTVVAEHWRIPENIRAAMAQPPVRRPNSARPDQHLLEAIAQFAHKLTNAVYRREPQAAQSSVNLVMNSFAPTLGLSHAAVKEVVDASLDETRDLFGAMGIRIDHLRLRRQTESALAGLI